MEASWKGRAGPAGLWQKPGPGSAQTTEAFCGVSVSVNVSVRESDVRCLCMSEREGGEGQRVHRRPLHQLGEGQRVHRRPLHQLGSAHSTLGDSSSSRGSSSSSNSSSSSSSRGECVIKAGWLMEWAGDG